MKKFWVIWTYSANYSKLMEIEAKDAEEAAKRATFLYGDRFHKEANIYVFDTKPAFQVVNG